MINAKDAAIKSKQYYRKNKKEKIRIEYLSDDIQDSIETYIDCLINDKILNGEFECFIYSSKIIGYICRKSQLYDPLEKSIITVGTDFTDVSTEIRDIILSRLEKSIDKLQDNYGYKIKSAKEGVFVFTDSSKILNFYKISWEEDSND